MKYVILGDLHIGVSKDDDTLYAYQSRFVDFLDEWCRTNIEPHRIIQVGDYFDSRTGLTHKALHRGQLIEKRLTNIAPLIVLVGNHDVPHKTDNNFDAPSQSLRSDLTKIVTGSVLFDGMLIVPWITRDNQEEIIQTIRQTDAKYLMGHFDIIGAKFSKYSGPSHEGIVPEELRKFRRVISGHYHTKSRIANIDFVGTPYELTWSDWDDPKGFHVFDPEENTLEFVEFPEKLHYKIFIDEAGRRVVPDHDGNDFSGKFVKIITTNTVEDVSTKIKEQIGEISGAVEVSSVINVDDRREIQANTLPVKDAIFQRIESLPEPDRARIRDIMQDAFNRIGK